MRAKTKKKLTVLLSTACAAVLAATGASALATTKAMADETESTGRVLYYVDAGYMVSSSDGIKTAPTEESPNGNLVYRNGDNPGYPCKTATPFMENYHLSFGTAQNDKTKLYNSVTDKPYTDTKYEWEAGPEGDRYTYSYQASYADPVTNKEWGFQVIKADDSVNTDYGWNTWRTWGCDTDALGFNTSRHTESNEGALVYKFEVDNATDDLTLRWGSMVTSDWGGETYPVNVNGSTLDVKVQALTRGNPSYYKWTPVVHGVEENGKYYVTVEFDKGRNQCVFINYIMLSTADYEYEHDEPTTYSAPYVVKNSDTMIVMENGIVPMPAFEATIKAESKAAINEANDFTEVQNIAFTVNGEDYTTSAYVVPSNTAYFVNAGSNSDKQYVPEKGYGWTTCVGANVPSWQDKDYQESGRYTGGTICYQFDALTGNYAVKIGSYGYWNMGREMEITVNGVKGDNLVVTANNIVNNTYYTTLATEGNINLEIAPKTGTSGADPVITYIWVYKVATVTFNANGGSEVESIVAWDGSIAKPTNPTREGYRFDGWYKEEALTTEVNFETDTFEADATLYAKWTKVYTVTFNSQGGSEVTAQTVAEGGKVTKPEDPTFTGYTFGGWYIDAGCTDGKEFDFENDTVTANATLYANWTVTKYTVAFDTQGGSEIASAEVEHGGKVKKPATDPTKTNQAFAGWYADAECNTLFDFETETITEENVTIYAKWVDLVTITFDSKGGSTVTAMTVGSGLKITEPTRPTQAGKAFLGWYLTDPETDTAAVKFNFANGTETDITLYAKWEDGYTITFNSMGGSTVQAQGVAQGANSVEPEEIPEKVGYTFGGWFTDEACENEYTFGGAVTADITLYAKWEVIEYTVSFEGADVADITVAYNNKLTKPVDPTSVGYTFGGWYKDSQCENAFDFENDVITENITLYAKWTINVYTVTFNTNEGSAVEPVNVDHGNKVTKPEDPTKEGYVFGGWFTEEGEEYDFDAEVTGDLMLVAKWTEDSTLPPKPEKPKGCKSSISASLAIVGGMVALGTAVIVIKKRKTDK